MSQHIRRPFAMGNTAAPVLSVPVMRGSVKKDSTGAFAALAPPAELCVETEDAATSGGLSVVLTTSSSADVVAQFNTTMAGFAVAVEEEGCLTIASVGVGDGAYIRVRPAIAGFTDASAAFGFEMYPHPLATVSAGDLEDAPVRPRQQVNPVGTKFVATGEDRTASAYNRALQMLAQNSDTAYTWLRRPVARTVELVVNSTTHAAYISTNVDGSIDQVDLTDLTVFSSDLVDARLYVGGLANNSTLRAISRAWSVTDLGGKQLAAGDATVRIGAVTRGKRVAILPAFTSEDTSPAGYPLPDSVATVPDGGNALGVDRVKHVATQINNVRQRTTVLCDSATFVTNMVRAGDVATISGATITDPFSHDGQYIVETVVSETELVLRPHEDSGHVRELNPAAGDFGMLTVTSGGSWERDIWVSFSPSLPRFPEDGQIVLVVPVEDALGDISLADIVLGDIRGSADVAGWTILQLWRNLTLDGAYQGMAAARGSGFYANVSHRALRFDAVHQGTPNAGTSSRTSTGTATLDAFRLRLTAAPADRFDTDDVGRTLLLNGGPFLTDEPWTITRIIDNATVEVAPPLHRAGYREVEGVTVSITSWTLVESDAIEFYGAMNVVVPAAVDAGADQTAQGGFFYTRAQPDGTSTDAPVPGLFSFLHLEHVRLHRTAGNIAVTTSPTTGADNVILLGFDPEDSSNFFAETYDTKTGLGQSSLTFVRVLNGPNIGLYRVKALHSSTVGVSSVEVQHLDGADVTFTFTASPAQVAFYTAVAGTAVPIAGGPRASGLWTAAQSLFVDGYEQDAGFVAALRLGWRGLGAGIYAYLNDPEFKSYDNGDGAAGPVAALTLHAPAEGLDVRMTAADTGDDGRRSGHVLRARAHTSRYDLALSAPTAEGPRFDTEKAFTAYVAQSGKDPAAVIVKQDADEDVSTAYSKLSPSAAFLLARGGATTASGLSGPSGRGSAAEVVGSVYVYRHTDPGAEAPAWSEGGVFVEDVVGAGRWLYPIVGVYDFAAVPEMGTGSFEGWEAPTQLGNPGQVWPTTSQLSVTADILPPDHAVFNIDHTALLYVADVTALGPTLSAPYNRLVGCTLYVTDPAATNHQVTFGITGSVLTATNELYLALQHPSVVVAGTDAARSFVIRGQRWHRAFLNIADYALLGTHDSAAARTDLPLLTADDDVLNARRTDVPGDSTLPDLGLQSYAPWSAAAVGVSLGNADDSTAAMSSVAVTSGAYTAAAGWVGDFASPIYRHGWTTDAVEPRSPFPNSALFSSTDPNATATPYLSSAVGYEGNLAADDFAASFLVGTASVSWSSGWGGCMQVTGATPAASVRLWQRGRTYVLSAHLSVRVQLRAVSSEVDTTMLVALRQSDGTVLVSVAAQLVPSAGVPGDVVALLSLDALSDAQARALLASKVTSSLHVTVDVTCPTAALVFILEYKTESLTRPAIVDGPQIVSGTQLAHGYRFTDPVPGFQTRGPADVRLLGGLDYARNESWPTYNDGADGFVASNTTGTQELRCTPGLVRMRNEAEYSDWYIAKELARVAIVGDVDAWMTALKTAATTGFNGGEYSSAADEAVAVSDACDASIAEGDPVQKLVLAEAAVARAAELVARLRQALNQLSSGTNSGSAATRSHLASYITDVEYAAADGAGDATNADAFTALMEAEPEENWIRPWVDYHRLFSQGVHSASITLYNGAFDPLWYARQADLITNDGSNLSVDSFVLPGTTGFLVALDPPHGSVLTSLAVGLSFRPHTAQRWGVYHSIPDDLAQLGRASATSRTYDDVALDTAWEAVQGVNVELWRYNCLDFDVAEDDFAGWTQHEAEFGFGERLAQWQIDLSGETEPGEEANTVADAWTTPGFGSPTFDVYAGKEHFQKRIWNLVDEFGASAASRARVDRRHYSYMLVVRFYGGMRTSFAGVDTPYVRGDKTSSGAVVAADPRWEIPQTIVRGNGNPDGTLVEGQIYGHFDNAYNVDNHDMNKPFPSPFPPVVKFRGARLGWITDRAGDGGWGT